MLELAAKPADEVVVEAAGHEVAITSPDKVLFPERGETKLDLVRYYQAVEGPLHGAPWAAGRCCSSASPTAPAGRRSSRSGSPRPARTGWRPTIVSTPNGTTSQALVARDLAHVLWAVNLACLGFHVWPYQAADPDHADQLRIDLDPTPGVTFAMVQEAAHEVRRAVRGAGRARRCPKTTGNRGIHVFVAPAAPLDLLSRCGPPRSPWPASSSAAAPT